MSASGVPVVVGGNCDELVTFEIAEVDEVVLNKDELYVRNDDRPGVGLVRGGGTTVVDDVDKIAPVVDDVRVVGVVVNLRDVVVVNDVGKEVVVVDDIRVAVDVGDIVVVDDGSKVVVVVDLRDVAVVDDVAKVVVVVDDASEVAVVAFLSNLWASSTVDSDGGDSEVVLGKGIVVGAFDGCVAGVAL